MHFNPSSLLVTKMLKGNSLPMNKAKEIHLEVENRGIGKNSRGRGRYSNERRTNDESSQKCNIYKMSSHVEKDCWFRGKPQYHNCKKFGHVQKDCRLKTNQHASFMEEK